MTQAYQDDDGDTLSEMVIVDTFTRLIFGEEHYSGREDLIIEALRLVDTNVALDNYRDMGQYLRALGVREMIGLVSRVETQLLDGIKVLASGTEKTALAPRRQRGRP